MGSNLRKRVCYKKRDLDAKSQMDKEDYREMQTTLCYSPYRQSVVIVLR